MSYAVGEIKSFQFELITKAGLAVSSEREMSKFDLERLVLEEFRLAVEASTLPKNLAGMTKNLQLRSRNLSGKTCSSDDLHTGDSLWRKFLDIKRIIINEF